MKKIEIAAKLAILSICSALLVTACTAGEMVQVTGAPQMPPGGETVPPEGGGARGTLPPEGGMVNLEGTYAITWHQEGGIAGVCLDVTVAADGTATAISCKGGNIVELGRTHLTDDQMNTLNAWVKQYRNYQFEHKDNAVADAMTVRLSFIGTGDQEVPQAVSIEMQRMAADLLKIIRK